MIKDLLEPYWTDEMRRQRDALMGEPCPVPASAGLIGVLGINPDAENLSELFAGPRDAEMDRLHAQAVQRYRMARTDGQIVADALDVLAGVEKTDYLEYLNDNRELSGIASGKLRAMLEVQAKEGYETCALFLGGLVSDFIELLQDNPAQQGRISGAVRSIAASWYPPAMVKYSFSSAVNAIAGMNPKKPAKKDRITGETTLQYRDFSLSMPAGDERFLIEVYKILVLSLIRLAAASDKKSPVTFMMDEYAAATGRAYDTDAARKKLARDVDKRLDALVKYVIYAPRSDNYSDRAVLVHRAVRVRGCVTVMFSTEMADAIGKENIVSWYPMALMRIPATHPNTFKLGDKMAVHAQMLNNIERGTDNILRVQNLLGCMSLPTYADVMQSNRAWVSRIKQPFEDALNALVQYGILSRWQYSHGGKAVLADAEVGDIKGRGFTYFEQLYILFEMRDSVNHQKLLEKRREKREKDEQKREKLRERAIERNTQKGMARQIAGELAKNGEFIESVKVFAEKQV